MKWQHIVMLTIFAVLTITVLVFFRNELFEPTPPLTENQQKAMQLLNLAKQSCLSGSSHETKVGLDFEAALAEKLKASAAIKDATSSGAVNYLDEQIRQVQDDKIRHCLEQQMPQIRACMLGDCEQASLPKLVDFKFSDPQIKIDNELSLPTARFAIQYREGNRILVPQDDGYFLDSIELFKKNESRLGKVVFQVREAHQQIETPIDLCLKRADPIDPKQANYTQFECKQGAGCKHDPMSPKWFDLCDDHQVQNHMATDLQWWAGKFLQEVLPAAYAQSMASVWAVPTLDTLSARIASEDLVGIGFTEFNIVADAPLNLDADAYYYDLKVNGQVIQIDGLPGDYNAQPYAPNQALQINFGLQNLNFSGVNDGCDELSISVQFVKDRDLVGGPIQWSRSYVSLRDASQKTLNLDNVNFSWAGKYHRAPKEYDTEVFVNSILISKDLDFASHHLMITKTQQTISKMKQEFDRAGLMFEGKPLVSVIRPPLTQISYGLAVGVVEKTGQIRYTYASDVAKRLKAFLLEKRNEAAEFKRIIRNDSFLYSLRGDKSYSVSPPICWDEVS
jgi:hypothetical protein